MSFNPRSGKNTNIFFNISSSNPNILEGLERWLELGLFSEQDIKHIAQHYLKCDTHYYISQQTITNPNFLEGLEIGLNLGFIAEDEVREMAQTYLVSAVNFSVKKPVTISEEIKPISKPQKAIEKTVIPQAKKPLSPPKPSIIKTFFTSFKEELSVRWLLFLGVFLVVLSSGVLAASQWDKFPAFVQYGVLLSYTLIFWGVGFYAAKQENLKLTAQTLQTITLLLTPVNFWAIDTFGLWDNILGGLIATIAIILLTGITIISNGEKTYLPLVINFLGLSLLHLGWEIQGVALIAVYISMIGTAINLRFILPRKFQSTLGHKPLTLMKTSFVSYGLGILLIRAIFVINIPIYQLGLAIGICGWLLTLEALDKNGLFFAENKRINTENKVKSPAKQGLEITGLILMLFGWLITFSYQPIQSILISGLALHWLSQRLITYWLKSDLFWIFMIGLQSIILTRTIIPDQFKENALNLSVEIAQSAQYPYTVYGLTLFPYLIFFIWLTGWLYQQDKKDLARFGEYLTLGLGICLTIISFYNPTWRSLNFILSTFALLYVSFRYENQLLSLVYFTHFMGLTTVISFYQWGIYSLNVNSNLKYWSLLFLGLMLLELGLSVLPFRLSKFKEIFKENNIKVNENIKNFQSVKNWFDSCWYFGLICTGLAYNFLLQELIISIDNISFYQGLSILIPLSLTGVAFFTYNSRRVNAAWISIAFLLLIQLITFSHPLVRIGNLILTTGLFFLNSRYVAQDKSTQTPLIYLNHLIGLITITVTINYLLPNLNNLQWNGIYLSLMIVEWGISLLRFNHQKPQDITENQENDQNIATNKPPLTKAELLLIWYESGWYFGLIFSFFSYTLFLYGFVFNININQYWFLLWGLTPISLTFMASQSNANFRKNTVIYSAISLVIFQTLTIWFPYSKIISLSLAMGLMLINTRYYPNLKFTNLHIAFGITLILSLGWDYLSPSELFILTSSLSLILWILQGIFNQNQGKIALLYGKSSQIWALSISNLTLLSLTLRYFYFPNDLYSLNYLISGIILIMAFIYNAKYTPIDRVIYSIGLSAEFVLLEGIRLINPHQMNIATGNIIFALITLFLSYSLASKFPRFSPLISWQILPLIYSLIGLILRLPLFNPYTGLLVIGASITGIGVSIRRKEWKWITYFSLAGITLGCYEEVIYPLSQSRGGSLADGLTILTLVTVAIALFYRIFIFIWNLRGKDHFLNFSLNELTVIAHFHWGLASILQLTTIAFALETSPQLTYLSLIINFFLGAYAVIQARSDNPHNQSHQQDWWVYVGLVEIVATFIYARLIFTNLIFLDPYQVVIVVFVALFIYQIPWGDLGWKPTPWHRFALVTPALIALTNSNVISIISLIFVAIFYARISFRQKNIRWSYISLGFIDWAIFLFFYQSLLNDPLWFISIIGLSILYIAQFDPQLSSPSYRKNRHNLRILGSGLITLSALIFHTQIWLIPVTISLIFLIIGLGLQIRAFLYVGTIVFMLTNFYQLVFLINQSSPSKWVVGFVMGIFLIFIAALFERKKETIFSTIQNWFDQLQKWQ
jgi:hypothetical protein